MRPELFSYGIDFENKPTATAPAQTVTVTQQLDSNLDWSTFQLGSIGFGDTVVNVPAGQTSYSTVVDLTATKGIDVDVSANFNPKTGLATWTFTSIDPATQDVPVNALAGFLPPDTHAGNGQGFVNYTVQPKATLTTGTTIGAKATVVFDTNAPLATAPIQNTIDAGAPTSSVNPLPAYSRPGFTVHWAGQDDKGGSGVGLYRVYVSDNGGPYQPFAANTAATSATFPGGQDGHTYSFYSIATDNVGNVQPAAAPAQSTTLILPANQLVITPARAALAGGTFSVNVAAVNADGLTDPLASGSVALSLARGTSSGSFSAFRIAPLVNGTVTFSNLSLSAPGTYTLFAAGSGALVAATAPMTVQAPPQLEVTLAPVTKGKTGAGQLFNVTALAMLNGKADTAYDGTVHIVSSDPHAGLPADQTLVGGSASFQVTLNTPGTQSVTVTDASLPTLNARSNTIIVTGTPPTGIDHFIVTGFPTSDVSGTSHSVIVTAVNVYGKTVSNYTGTVQLTSTLSGFPPATVRFTPALKGVARATVDLTTLGTQALVATDGSGKTGAETGINVVSPAKHLSVVDSLKPASTTISAGGQVVVTVTALTEAKQLDQQFADNLQLAVGDPHAMVVAQPIVGGAQFTVTFQTAGAWTIRVSDQTRPAVTGPSLPVRVMPGIATQLSISPYPMYTTAGVKHQVMVTAEDSDGNVVPSFTDQITIAGSRYTFQAGDHGMHAFNIAFTALGSATLTASDRTHATVRSTTDAGITVIGGPVGLIADPAVSAASEMVVIAPPGGNVVIRPADQTGTILSVTINGAAQSVPAAPPSAPLAHLLVYAQSGTVTVTESTLTIKHKTSQQTVYIAVPAMLLGGSGTNTLSAAGSRVGNVLVGGPANDSLTGGLGADILIGGGGADTLNAGKGGDILIGGSTGYDANVAALLAWLAEWSNSNDIYVQRVANLFGTGGNGANFLNAAAMVHDNAVNQLNGGTGQDWFWFSTGDKLTGYRSAEVASFD